MKTIRFKPDMAALQPNVDPFEIKNSIVLVEDDIEHLIGDDAVKLGVSGVRITGGTIRDRHYQRLLKALLAKGLGAGQHTISVGLSASSNYMNEFRESMSKNVLNKDDYALLESLVKEIKFRDGRTDAPVQICNVTLKREKPVPVLYETEAVRNVIPKEATTYAIFQIGGGDWQSMLVVDGEICVDTHTRVAGVNNCITKLAEHLDVSPKTADKAWFTNTKPNPNGGIDNQWIDCTADKAKVIRGFISAQLPQLLNSFEGHKDRIKAIVISGGAVNDDTFINILKDEIPQKLRVHTFHDFECMEPNGGKLMSASFTCAFGIYAHGVDVGLDIGNAYLKGVFDV